MEGSIDKSPLDFLRKIIRLKHVKRAGWENRHIKDSESVADHSYGIAMLTWLLPDRFDRPKAMEMALVHDFAESEVGDLTPKDGVPKHVKRMREDFDFRYTQSLLSRCKPEVGSEMQALWQEYADGHTPLAKAVKQLDRLDLLLTLLDYEISEGQEYLDSFADVVSMLTSSDALPEIKPWVDMLLQERKTRLLQPKDQTPVIFVIGGPGVGKGTQCRLLAEEFGFQHISLGEVLRVKRDDPTYREAKFVGESLDNRPPVAVPTEVANRLLKSKIHEGKMQGRNFALLDGFPRSLKQIFGWEREVRMPYYTLFLECSAGEMFRRTQVRGQTSDRPDDKPEAAVARLEAFHQSNAEIVDYLGKGNLKTIKCDGTPEQVYSLVKEAVQEIVHNMKKVN